MYKNLFLALSLSFLTVSCITVPVTTQNFKQVANTHKTLAVLPVKIQITYSGTVNKKETEASEKEISYTYQQYLVDEMKNQTGPEDPVVQDYATTRRILEQNGITSLTGRDYAEIGKLLGVDAVVMARVSLPPQQSIGEQVALNILLTPNLSPEGSRLHFNLIDVATRKNIWEFNTIVDNTWANVQNKMKAALGRSTRMLPYYESPDSPTRTQTRP